MLNFKEFNIVNWDSFTELIDDLLFTESVQGMRDIPHHIGSCFEHSIFVSYVSFRIARKLKLDYRAAARGGLLHDLYLYGPLERWAMDESHFLGHPYIALANAMKLCELTPKEANIIVSHMWPLSRILPQSREAIIVNCVDKYCATAEALGIWRRMTVSSLIPAQEVM